jgi:hypothetical protein
MLNEVVSGGGGAMNSNGVEGNVVECKTTKKGATVEMKGKRWATKVKEEKENKNITKERERKSNKKRIITFPQKKGNDLGLLLSIVHHYPISEEKSVALDNFSQHLQFVPKLLWRTWERREAQK